MHKRRGEEIEQHANSSKLCNTVPGVNWEMRVVGVACLALAALCIAALATDLAAVLAALSAARCSAVRSAL